MSSGAGARLPSGPPKADAVLWRQAALSLIKYFWWGGGEEEGCPGRPRVIGVESGWRLLKCVEGLHFVVWGGNGAPRTLLGLCLHSVCPSGDFALGPRLFPRKPICSWHCAPALLSGLFLKCFNQ